MKDKVVRYLKSLLGFSIVIKKITDSERKRLGAFVNFYEMKATHIDGRRHLLAFAKVGQRYTPHAVAKQFSMIRAAVDLPVVFVPCELAPHDSARLIAAKVPYVYANRGLYLPEAGLVLARPNQTPVLRETFSVPAQLFVSGYLLKKWNGRATISEVMQLTGYSFASIVHAFQELEHFGAGVRELDVDGRSMRIVLNSPSAIWEQCRSRFFNPCKRTIGVIEKPKGAVLAGVDALAEMSDLNEDSPTCFAFPLKGFRKTGIEECSVDLAPIRLQLWHFNPMAIGGDKIDPLSLYLTLRNDPDDRVQIQLAKLEETFKW